MLPELEILFKFGILFIIFIGVIFWLGTIFQNIKFQKYRLFRNEAAHRKARLHDELEEKDKYRTDLLGKVLSAKEDSGDDS
jgi:hypothetical protein